MTGHEREAMRAVAATTVLNLALGMALIPRWGENGAAFATASTFVALNGYLFWRVRRLLGIRSSPW
jgi:O-antigen/teichoic acid export membrane protein